MIIWCICIDVWKAHTLLNTGKNDSADFKTNSDCFFGGVWHYFSPPLYRLWGTTSIKNTNFKHNISISIKWTTEISLTKAPSGTAKNAPSLSYSLMFWRWCRKDWQKWEETRGTHYIGLSEGHIWKKKRCVYSAVCRFHSQVSYSALLSKQQACTLALRKMTTVSSP